jgi:hypothetical protein
MNVSDWTLQSHACEYKNPTTLLRCFLSVLTVLVSFDRADTWVQNLQLLPCFDYDTGESIYAYASHTHTYTQIHTLINICNVTPVV